MKGFIYVVLLSFTFGKAGFVFLPNVFQALSGRFHQAASSLMVGIHYSRASLSETDVCSHSIRSCPNLTFGYFHNFPKKHILKLISDSIRIINPFTEYIFFSLLQISVCKRVKQQGLTT